MNALQRVTAILQGETPDRVPFVPDEWLVPRGEQTRRLRNNALGLCRPWLPTHWSSWPHTASTDGKSDWMVAAYPGELRSLGLRPHRAGTCPPQGKDGPWIKDAADYAGVVACLDDEQCHPDFVAYDYACRDLGGDGVVKVAGPVLPAVAAQALFDDGGPGGPERWRQAKAAGSCQYARLLAALHAREERRIQAVADSPGRVMSILTPGTTCDGERFRGDVLSCLQEYGARLLRPGRTLALCLATEQIRSFYELIPLSGVGMVEGFTPAPYGDVSLAEARRAWGPDVVIWLNFPQEVFREGAAVTRDYARDLLASDGGERLIFGMLRGAAPAADEETWLATLAGLAAVLDAIDEHAAGR